MPHEGTAYNCSSLVILSAGSFHFRDCGASGLAGARTPQLANQTGQWDSMPTATCGIT